MAVINRSPVVRFAISGETEEWADVLVHAFKLDRSLAQHDRAQLQCSSAELTTVDGIQDKAISFTFGRPPNTEIFYGYVMEAEPTTGRSQTRFEFGLQLYGSTLRAQQIQKPRIWKNEKSTLLLEKVAAEAGHGFYGVPEDFALSAYAQTRESNWESLTELATWLGLSIFNYQGVVIALDASTYFFEMGEYAQISAKEQVSGDDSIHLESFKSNKLTHIEKTRGIEAYYFTPNGHIQSVKQDETKYRSHVHAPQRFRSQIEAQRYIKGVDQLSERWVEVGQAVIAGNAGIRPGVNVGIEETIKYYNPNNGRWFVLGVSHQMQNEEFKTQIALGRPKDYKTAKAKPYEPFWILKGKPRPTMVLEEYTDAPATTPPPATAPPKKHRWRSSWVPTPGTP